MGKALGPIGTVVGTVVGGPVGGAIGGAIGGALGGASGAKGASKDAKKAANSELGFAKERYSDWQAIYGPIQKSLATEYQNIGSEGYIAKDLQNFEMEKNKALTKVRETLAQRGIGTSGLAGQLETDFAIGTAQERAQIRADAPMKAAQEKARFLSLGLASNPADSVQKILSDRNSFAQKKSEESSAASGDAIGSLIKTGIDIFASKTA